MRLILVNGVYGAPEHFDALRAALAPDVCTEVFTFSRQGEPDPHPEHAFTPMVRRLEACVRGIAADRPGPPDGSSPPSRPALLGFSLGGALALEYALRHSDQLSALVLVNAFDRYHLAGLQPGALPPFWRVPVRIRHRGLMSRVVHRLGWLRRGLFHDRASLDDVDRGMQTATASVSSDDLRFQLAHLGLPLPRGQSSRLAELAERLPVLLIGSRDDMVVAPYHTERLARIMPAARRLPPFEGGHAFFQHDGGALAAAVRAFLRELR
jgi:pimeloyl-ACP methyl ester carboxylesterase